MGYISDQANAIFAEPPGGTFSPASIRALFGYVDASIATAGNISALAGRVTALEIGETSINENCATYQSAIDTINAEISSIYPRLAGYDTFVTSTNSQFTSVTANLVAYQDAFNTLNGRLVGYSAFVSATNSSFTSVTANLVAYQAAFDSINTFVTSATERLASLEADAPLLNSLLNGSALIRPGDASKLFCSSIAGGDPNLLPANFPGQVISTADGGAALRVTTAGTVASRQMHTIEPTRSYKVRGVFFRRIDTPDPAGDALQFGVAWYDGNKVPLAAASTIVSDLDIYSFMGRRELSAVITATGSIILADGTTATVPTGACYARPFVVFYGNTHTTDVQVVSWTDVTESGLISPNVDAISDRVGSLESLGLGPRVANVENVVANPTDLYAGSVAAAKAVHVQTSVTSIHTTGYTIGSPGAGAASYVRTAGTVPGGFKTADGAFWQLAEARATAAMFGAAADGSADASAVLGTLPAGAVVYLDDGTYRLDNPVTSPATLILSANAVLSGSGSVAGDIRRINGLDDGVLKGLGAADGNYDAYTGAPIRTPLRTLLRDWRHASDNGAEPERPDNGYCLSVALLEGAARAEKTILGKGTYALAGTVASLISGSTLEGQGPGHSTLRLANGAGHALVNMADFSSRFGNTRIRLLGMTLDYNGSDPGNAGVQGIQVAEATSVEIGHLELINVGGNAINVAPLDNQPGAPYSYSPPPQSGAPTFNGQATAGSNLISSCAFTSTLPKRGDAITASGFPTGLYVTGVYPTQVSVSGPATATNFITVAFDPVEYQLPSTPDGTNFPGIEDFYIHDIVATSVATLGGATGGGIGSPLSDFFVLYHIKRGLAKNIRLIGGGANQFSFGLCQDFDLENIFLDNYWRGLYMETNVGCSVRDLHIGGCAPRPIHPYLQNDPPKGVIITTAEQSYSSGAAGVMGAPYDGGRSISIDQLHVDGMINTFSNRGPRVVEMDARNSYQSKSVTIIDPSIQNVQATGGSAPDGGASTPATAFKLLGMHEDFTVRGGRVAYVNRVLDDGVCSLDGASSTLINPALEGVSFEQVTDIAVNFSHPLNHSGLRLSGNRVRGGVNQIFGAGVTSSAHYTAYGNVGSDSGGASITTAGL